MRVSFFTIYNATTGAVAYNQTFIGDDVSSVTVPAGTLQPGAAYYDELIFSTAFRRRIPIRLTARVRLQASALA